MSQENEKSNLYLSSKPSDNQLSVKQNLRSDLVPINFETKEMVRNRAAKLRQKKNSTVILSGKMNPANHLEASNFDPNDSNGHMNKIQPQSSSNPQIMVQQSNQNYERHAKQANDQLSHSKVGLDHRDNKYGQNYQQAYHYEVDQFIVSPTSTSNAAHSPLPHGIPKQLPPILKNQDHFPTESKSPVVSNQIKKMHQRIDKASPYAKLGGFSSQNLQQNDPYYQLD